MENMKFGSLFSGIGVFDTAAQAAGMSVEFGCDNHPFCKFWYEEHFPNAAFYGDIKTLDTIPYVDVVAFGFPCQDASLANSKKINNPLEGERTGLYYEAIRIINNSAKRPRWLVIENVPRILTHSGHAVFQELSKSGYNAGWAILPACAFGALHRRERLFIVAHTNQGRWNKISEVLRKVLEKTNNQKERREEMGRQLHRAIREDTQQETTRGVLRALDGLNGWIYDGIRASAVGNAIYYPIAEAIINAIKEVENDSTTRQGVVE